MQVYFSPLACSLATRIALYTAGAEASFVRVHPQTKITDSGSDYRTVHSLGSVPALLTDDGELITESAAVLQYLADKFPAAKLAPPAGMERVRLQQWLSFIGAELHTRFSILLRPAAPQGAKQHAREELQARLAFVDAHLASREFLLDGFSVADALLFVVLLWSSATAIDLARYPALALYVGRLHENPSVKRAFTEEYPWYLQDEAAVRQAAATP